MVTLWVDIFGFERPRPHAALTRMTTDAAMRSCDKALDASGKQRKICAIQQLAKMFGEQSTSFAELVCTQKITLSIVCLA